MLQSSARDGGVSSGPSGVSVIQISRCPQHVGPGSAGECGWADVDHHRGSPGPHSVSGDIQRPC